MTQTIRPVGTGALRAKTALVTGGNRGIGAAIAAQFALAGYSVAITYRTGQKEAENTVGRIATHAANPIHAVHLDLEREDTITRAVDLAVKALGGKVDVLVNNAGYADMSAPDFIDISHEVLTRTIKTNIVGPFLVTQAVVPHIPRGGAVINLGSCLGKVCTTSAAAQVDT